MYIRLTTDCFLALWICIGDILLCIIALRVIKICDLLKKRKKEDDSEPVHRE